MHRQFRSFLPALLLTAALVLTSCETFTRNANTAPVIQQTYANPAIVTTNGVTTLACQATDSDGDSLEYSWSAPSGSFPQGAAGNPVTWQAPATTGTCTITVDVNDGTDSAEDSLSVVVVENTAPVAAFIVDPGSGDEGTVFTVDATPSTDLETPGLQLEVRWDWENDGEYDTDWTTTRTATHQYDSAGTFTIQLQVRDAGGMTDETTRTVIVFAEPTVVELIFVTAGSFQMGSDDGDLDEQPVHPVTFTRSFLLSRDEVTNQAYLTALQWAYDNGYAFVSDTSVYAHGHDLLDLDGEGAIAFVAGGFHLNDIEQGTYQGGASTDHPVLELSWFGAACFCDWLSLMEGWEPFYAGDWSVDAGHNPYEAEGYTLPTEAEWEYTARYDDGRIYPWGDIQNIPCQNANFNDCVGWTAPVGSFPSGNSLLGFRDMAGNILEFVNDWYESNAYESSAETDPLGPALGVDRVMRGGGWLSQDYWLRSSCRAEANPEGSYQDIGFRVCRRIQP